MLAARDLKQTRRRRTKKNKTRPSLALAVWNSLNGKPNLERLNNRLAEMGYWPVSRTCIYRWRREHQHEITAEDLELVAAAAAKPLPKPPPPPVAAAKRPAPPPEASPPVVAPEADPLKGISKELVDLLGVRMLMVAKGEGLDRVEDAVIAAAAVIADRIGHQDVEGRRIDSVSLLNIAQAMALVATSRKQFSLADLELAEAEKLRAEADNIRASGRADNAWQINGRQINGSNSMVPYDREAEDEAVTAMRELENRK